MSCVYMIKCLDETIPEIYIGSTSNYKKRQSEHKINCNNPNRLSHNTKLYRFMRSKGGFDKFKFEIIEECGEYNKLELEKMYIEMYNPELNTHKYNFDMKEYRENNKEKIAEYRKEYCEKNKDKIKKQDKEYREKNKEKIKEYREKNKEKLKKYRKERNKEIICCRVCRCEITKVNFKKHCKSKKHIANELN